MSCVDAYYNHVILIGDIITYDQRDRLEYIHDILGYNTDLISDIPCFFK